MPFLFAYVCDLLEKLEIPFLREVGFLPGTLREYLRQHTSHWFKQHCVRLNAFSTDDNAVLSMLRPHHQNDRVYGLDPERLELVIARALSFSKSQFLEVRKWRIDPLKRDLAFFVERVMKESKSGALGVDNNKVTAEDIDQVLLQIAAYHPDSSIEVRSLAPTWPDADHVSLLGDLYRNLQPREAKWLTRLVMKSLGPLEFPEDLELSASSGHSHLPQCLKVSIKMQTGGAGAVRRSGPMTLRGYTNGTDSSAIVETPVRADHPSKGNQTSFLPTPPTSSIAVPVGNPMGQNLATITSARYSPLTPQTSPPTIAAFRDQASTSQRSMPTALSSLGSVSTISKSGHLPPDPEAPIHTTAKPLKKLSRQANQPKLVFDAPGQSTLSAKSRRPSRTALGELSSNATSSSQSSQSQTTSQKLSRPFITGTGKCLLSNTYCPLKRYIFVLSPCVASNSYVTDALLFWHGSNYLSGISSINYSSLPQCCPNTGERYLKIVLVESNAPRPTSTFLKQIGKLQLTKGGKKEWLRVYDWRLLESLGKADLGKTLSHDPWVRLFIGRI